MKPENKGNRMTVIEFVRTNPSIEQIMQFVDDEAHRRIEEMRNT